MTTTVALPDGEAAFADCVKAAEAGEDFIILRDGKPAARLLPFAQTEDRRAKAWARFREILNERWVIDAGPFDRAAAHER